MCLNETPKGKTKRGMIKNMDRAFNHFNCLTLIA